MRRVAKTCVQVIAPSQAPAGVARDPQCGLVYERPLAPGVDVGQLGRHDDEDLLEGVLHIGTGNTQARQIPLQRAAIGFHEPA
jgi:hypothetical protein